MSAVPARSDHERRLSAHRPDADGAFGARIVHTKRGTIGRTHGQIGKSADDRPARLAKKKSRHARALNRLGVKGPLRVHSAVVVAAKRITNYVAPVSQETR